LSISAEHYKEMAERCKRTAEAPPNIKIKKQFMDLARQWRELAEHAKRRGEERLKKPSC
jgi:hypothetical protein